MEKYTVLVGTNTSVMDYEEFQSLEEAQKKFDYYCNCVVYQMCHFQVSIENKIGKILKIKKF